MNIENRAFHGTGQDVGECKILPENFEDGLRKLFSDIFSDTTCVQEDLGQIVARLEEVLEKNNLYKAGGKT